MEQILSQGIEIFFKVKQEFINNCPCLNSADQQKDANQAYGQPPPPQKPLQTEDGFDQTLNNGGVYEMQPYATENGTGYANPNELQFQEDEEEEFDEFKTSEKISEWQAGW